MSKFFKLRVVQLLTEQLQALKRVEGIRKNPSHFNMFDAQMELLTAQSYFEGYINAAFIYQEGFNTCSREDYEELLSIVREWRICWDGYASAIEDEENYLLQLQGGLK